MVTKHLHPTVAAVSATAALAGASAGVAVAVPNLSHPVGKHHARHAAIGKPNGEVPVAGHDGRTVRDTHGRLKLHQVGVAPPPPPPR